MLASALLLTIHCGVQEPTFLPSPLPDWADTLEMKQDESYVNERPGVAAKYQKPKPEISIGDLIHAIPEDDVLVPGDHTVKCRPIGRKETLDEISNFTVYKNGFSRRLIFERENTISYYELVAEPRPGDGRLFLAWRQKLITLFGQPTYNRKFDLDNERQERATSNWVQTTFLDLDDRSRVVMVWVWGRTGPRTDRSNMMRSDETEHTTYGPQYVVSLIYGAPTRLFSSEKDGRGKQQEARVQFVVNPTGSNAD